MVAKTGALRESELESRAEVWSVSLFIRRDPRKFVKGLELG